jgi:SH3-like domain-containing protein
MSRSEKASFTAFGAICADGRKLPLWVIAKGKTVNCEKKFGHNPDVVMRHSESGWATENLIMEYLQWIHDGPAEGEPCVLVLDVYPTHRTDKVQQLAEHLDIELLYVPSGGNGEYQLLDRRVFGELKSAHKPSLRGNQQLRGSSTLTMRAHFKYLCNSGTGFRLTMS